MHSLVRAHAVAQMEPLVSLKPFRIVFLVCVSHLAQLGIARSDGFTGVNTNTNVNAEAFVQNSAAQNLDSPGSNVSSVSAAGHTPTVAASATADAFAAVYSSSAAGASAFGTIGAYGTSTGTPTPYSPYPSSLSQANAQFSYYNSTPTTLNVIYASNLSLNDGLDMGNFLRLSIDSHNYSNSSGSLSLSLLNPGFTSFSIGMLAHRYAETGSTYSYWGTAAIIVNVDGAPLPGATKFGPIILNPGQRDDGAVEPASVAGAYLVAPIADSYGVSNPIFAGPGSGTPPKPIALPPGINFESLGPNITSFTIPDALANGDSTFTVTFGGVSQVLNAGSTIDFTQFVPGGVSQFHLSGFSPATLLAQDNSPPFVWGATYAANGLAEVNVYTVPNWSGPGSGSFNQDSNWTTGSVSSGVNSEANFLGSITAPSTVTLDSNVTLGTLTFDSSNSYTLAGTGRLTLQVSSGTASINVLSGSHTISAPIILASNLNVALSDGTALAISGNISESITGSLLTLSNSGTLILSGSNSYTGGTTVDAGTLVFASSQAIGGSVANVTVNYGATVAAGYAMDQTFLSRLAVSSSGVAALATDSSNPLSFAGFTNMRLGATGTSNYSGTLTPDGNTYRLGGGGGVLTVSGPLSGTNNVDVGTNGTVAGIVILAGANTYSGSTQVSGGTLQLGNASALGASGLTADAGSVDLAGYSPTVTNLRGAAGTITNSGSADSILTVNQATATTCGGSLADGATNKIALSLTGTGTLVLSGSNTYTGGTIVTAGTLILAASDSIEDGTSLTVGANASSIFGGAAVPQAASPAAVPEPNTLLLLGAAVCCVAVYRRKCSRRKQDSFHTVA